MGTPAGHVARWARWHDVASLQQASVQLGRKLASAHRLAAIAITAAAPGFALAAYALAN